MVLGTLHAVISRTGGDVRSITINEAEWVARLRRGSRLSAWDAYVYARRYIASGGSSEALDIEVATHGDDDALYAATRTRRLRGQSRARSGAGGQLTIRRGEGDAN